MRIRSYRREDISDCASIFCNAFVNNDLFAFIAPYRREYPDSWRRLAIEREQSLLVDPAAWGLVCVSDCANEDEEIIGFAWWIRIVPQSAQKTDKYLLHNSSISARTEQFLRSIEKKYKTRFCPNPCLCRSNDDVIASAMGDNFWAPLEQTPFWHLKALAVAPQHQRKGVGRMLVEWGLQQASEESLAFPENPPVPVTLISSPHGQNLYHKLGFKVLGWKRDIFAEWERAVLADPTQRRKELHAVWDRIVREIGEGSERGGSCMLFESKRYWTEDVTTETLVEGGKVELVWAKNATQRG